MIKREEINGMIFIAQTTYYIYESDEKLRNSEAIITTSNKELFDANKKLAKIKEKNQDKVNKFIVL